MQLKQAMLDAGYEPVYERIPKALRAAAARGCLYANPHEVAQEECKEIDARLRDATTWEQVMEALDHVY